MVQLAKYDPKQRPLTMEELAYYGTSKDGGAAQYPTDTARAMGASGYAPDPYRSSSNYVPGASNQWARRPTDPGGDNYDPFFPNGTGEGQPDPRWQSNSAGGPGIASRFQDSYQQLLNSMQQGQSGPDALRGLLQNFGGSSDDLRHFMETPMFRTVMAFAPKNMPEYQKLRDLKDPTLQQMNVGLGQISSSGARGIQEALQALNQSGQGRNAGAVAAIQQGGQMDTAARSAMYGSGMQQQAYQNQMNQLNNMIDLENQMSQLALGFSPQPRQPSNKASTGDWIGLAGTLIGGALGGPLGAALGGGAGSALGRSAQPNVSAPPSYSYGGAG